MATRTESRFGVAKALAATTYTLVATVAASTTANLLIHVANLTAGTVKVRLYIADTTWSTGAPSGSTLIETLAFDETIVAGAPPLQISGVIANTGDKIVAYCDTASGVDVGVHGVAIT